MAPGRGGRGGRGAPEETVVVDGKTLRRVLDEASKRWVYRPVDAASGETISKDDFEARRREEEAARRASDPGHRAAEEKRWLEQQRGEIREKRAEAFRAMRREEHHAALRDGRVERRRPRRKGALANVPVPDALAELREEMRAATLRETREKNPGRFAFIETALAVEEKKYETALDAARRRAYAAERRRRGVRGAAGAGSGSARGDETSDASETDSDDAPFAIRGSAADLDDPDYRRGSPTRATGDRAEREGASGRVPAGVRRDPDWNRLRRSPRDETRAPRLRARGVGEGDATPSALQPSSARGGRAGRGPGPRSADESGGGGGRGAGGRSGGGRGGSGGRGGEKGRGERARLPGDAKPSARRNRAVSPSPASVPEDGPGDDGRGRGRGGRERGGRGRGRGRGRG